MYRYNERASSSSDGGRIIQYRGSPPDREFDKNFRTEREFHKRSDYDEESDYKRSRFTNNHSPPRDYHLDNRSSTGFRSTIPDRDMIYGNRERSPVTYGNRDRIPPIQYHRSIERNPTFGGNPDRSPVRYHSSVQRSISPFEYRSAHLSPRGYYPPRSPSRIPLKSASRSPPEYRYVEIKKDEGIRRHRKSHWSRDNSKSWSRSRSRSRSRSWSAHKLRSRTRTRSRSRGSSPYLYHRRSPVRDERSWKVGSRSSRRSSSSRERKHTYRSRKGSRSPKSSSKDDWVSRVWNAELRSEVETMYKGSGSERRSWHSQSPNQTIIIRGLAYHVNGDDIRNEIRKTGVTPRDIRLIRKKDSPDSSGYAFIEFDTVKDAITMMEAKNGELKFGDGYKIGMQYSIDRDGDKDSTIDWYCNCSALNFKRRKHCYKCGLERKYSEMYDNDDVSTNPTNTVILKGLDLSTTEEDVLKAIQSLSSLPIRNVRIGTDKSSNTIKGICYLEMNNVSDAMYLHNTLLSEKLRIDKKTVLILYGKTAHISSNNQTLSSISIAKPGDAAVAAAQWSHQKSDILAQQKCNSSTNLAPQYTMSDVPRLAEYSADLYAKSPEEKIAFLKHYIDYYTKIITEGGVVPNLGAVETNPALTGYLAPSVSPSGDSSVLMACAEPPSGMGEQTYPVPDVSTYQYDSTSGYYYDPFTTLYYDAKSQYYFNSAISKYLYWDGLKKTYLLAPSAVTVSSGPVPAEAPTTEVVSTTTIQSVSDNKLGHPEETKKAIKVDDKDKVKVAKRIAKDMEKWAKTLNHKKEVAKQNIVVAPGVPVSKVSTTAAAADIGFAVLGRKEAVIQSAAVTTNMFLSPSSGGPIFKSASLVAEYGHGSDSEEDNTNEELQQDDKHVDWVKLACLLCKRAFPNKETLLKHQQLSDLHKQNLEMYYQANGISREDASKKSNLYRDRAKERRTKYGEPDVPIQTNKWGDPFMKAVGKQSSINYEQPNKEKIGSENLGNKLLQKMGWQEGMGLGKSNQGMTDIITARARPLSAGLGSRSEGITPGPGETYKDCVKKMMRSRYEERDS